MHGNFRVSSSDSGIGTTLIITVKVQFWERKGTIRYLTKRRLIIYFKNNCGVYEFQLFFFSAQFKEACFHKIIIMHRPDIKIVIFLKLQIETFEKQPLENVMLCKL